MIRTHGRDLHLEHRPGDPGRIPLLLCNGIGSSLEIFDPFIAQLDPDRPVVRFDAPGIGASSKPVLPYRFPTLARTVRGALDQLNYSSVDVLGISWGGALAQQLAFQYPRWCRRLVLVATGTGWMMAPPKAAVLGKMVTPRRHRDREYAARIAGDLYGGSARQSPPTASQLLHDRTHPPSVRGYAYQLFAITGWASLPFLPFLRQPTLLLAGDDDPIVPPVNATIMSRLLPNVTLHLYHGGHLALATESAELAPVIDSFLGASRSRATCR